MYIMSRYKVSDVTILHVSSNKGKLNKNLRPTGSGMASEQGRVRDSPPVGMPNSLSSLGHVRNR